MFCGQCGVQILESVSFCGSCGAPVDQTATAPSQPVLSDPETTSEESLVVSRVMCEIVHAQILKEWKVMAYFPYRV